MFSVDTVTALYSQLEDFYSFDWHETLFNDQSKRLAHELEGVWFFDKESKVQASVQKNVGGEVNSDSQGKCRQATSNQGI